MAAHKAPEKPRKWLRVLGVGTAGLAAPALVGTLVFGPMAAQAAFADEAPATSSTTTSAPASAAPAAPPTTGTPATDQQQKPATPSSDQSAQPAAAPAPSGDSASPAPAVPAPSPAPSAAPAAPASPAPAAAPSPSPSTSPSSAAAAPAAPQATLTTQPKVVAAPQTQQTDFQIDRIPATCQSGERVVITTPTAANLNQLDFTTIRVNNQDLTSVQEFLQQAVGVAGQPNTYDIEASAAEGYQFPNQLVTIGYSDGGITLDPPIPATDPRCAPTKVENPQWSYTFDSATGTVVVTVTGGKDGQLLAKPLYIRPAAWTYDQPVSPQAPSWSQTLVGEQDANDLVIDRIGTFSTSPPQVATCRQYDVYASFDGFGALGLPNKLYGPNNPNEPTFLHQVLPGAGPNPTYSYTSTEGCNTPPPPTLVTVTTPEVPPLVCGEAGSWTPPSNTDDVIYLKNGNVLTAVLNRFIAVPLSSQGSSPTTKNIAFGPLPEGWVLSESGNSATYTVVFPPVECPSNHGSSTTRGTTDCTTHTTVITTEAWTQSSSWNGESYTYGEKVFTKTQTTVAQNDAEKATCPITVVIHNPPQNPTVQTVAETPSSSNTLAHTGSDISGEFWAAIWLLGAAGALFTIRQVVKVRKSATSK